MSAVHRLRRELRAKLDRGTPVQGTFVKLPSPDVVEMVSGTDLDFVVVDLEHSTLTERDALALVRHADAVGVPALVRIPHVDSGVIARLLENGATGIQLSTLRTSEQTEALVGACHHAPLGQRSVSLANRVAGFGRTSLATYLDQEREAPPFLVGQIETDVRDFESLLEPLDVAFVGTTDLAVHLGLPPSDVLESHVAEIRAAAVRAGTQFGGWTATRAGASALPGANYVVVGSDIQTLASALQQDSARERD